MRFTEDIEKRQFTCCICHRICHGYGNNPQPLIMKRGSRCCDDCDMLVIASRLYVSDNIKSEEELEHFEKMPFRKKLSKIEKSFARK